MGRRTIEFFAKSERDSFGVNEAVGKVKIRAHSFCVYDKARQQSCKLVRRSGGEAHNFRNHFPFGLPGTEAALIFARKSSQDGTDESGQDRKSTRLNSSHLVISYAVFWLKKKRHL